MQWAMKDQPNCKFNLNAPQNGVSSEEAGKTRSRREEEEMVWGGSSNMCLSGKKAGQRLNMKGQECVKNGE